MMRVRASVEHIRIPVQMYQSDCRFELENKNIYYNRGCIEKFTNSKIDLSAFKRS